MTLRVRIALTMAILTALTAAAVAAAGYRVTAGRLDSEINASIAAVAGPVSRSPREANRACFGPAFQENDGGEGPGLPDNDGTEKSDRSTRRTPRVLLVQCLTRVGVLTARSPSTEMPITAADRNIAKGTGPASKTSQAKIDGEPHRIVIVGVRGTGPKGETRGDVGAVQISRSLAERNRILSGLLRRVLGSAGAAIVVTALVGLWLARRIAQPLVALTGAAEAIAENGQLDVPLADVGNTRNETGRLSHAFATMVDSLRQSREQQARLVQDAGHELRTPLTSLRTNIALLRRPDLPEAKRNGILADLSSELLELTMITNELISLSSNSAEDDRPTPIDIADLLDDVVSRWRRRSGRPIEVTQPSGEDESWVVLLPRNGAQRVLDNLFSNAVKFSPAPTPIDVQLLRTPTNVSVTVRDHGPGVAPKDLGHVFDRFYRSDEARPLHGSGLGLSIAHDVVTRHGGAVTVANHPDGGAMFIVSIPLVSVKAEGPRATTVGSH